jgi:hypothetical protein
MEKPPRLVFILVLVFVLGASAGLVWLLQPLSQIPTNPELSDGLAIVMVLGILVFLSWKFRLKLRWYWSNLKYRWYCFSRLFKTERTKPVIIPVSVE